MQKTTYALYVAVVEQIFKILNRNRESSVRIVLYIRGLRIKNEGGEKRTKKVY